MKFRSSLFATAMAGFMALSAVACAPAADSKFPPAGYDTTAPQLPDDPGSDSSEPTPEKVDPSLEGLASRFETPNLTSNQKSQVLAKYNYIDQGKTIRTALLEKAVLYFDANKSRMRKTTYMSVLDFSKPSNVKRLHVIDMKTGAVWSLHVAHGSGSDSNHDAYAEKFSNSSGSNASSLGAYLTAETYSGKHGYSLRLDGLSSTNSAARSRAVVIHGASYVKDSNVKQGRSWGCPAISMTNRTKLIDTVKGGSLIFAGN